MPDKVLQNPPLHAERFLREGQLLARLHHPNIVMVHDIGQTHGFFYLIMEYVDGVNLREVMRADRFTPQQALAIVPQVCESLQYAHQQGVLHRDIKPENILLNTQGQVKIADFGISKLVNQGEHTYLTDDGMVLGTLHYMAPEQFESPATVDHRADIYSLGVVFYELLTGELPIGRFAPPSEKASVDVGLDEVVFKSLEKDRERRQQSAEELRTDVETSIEKPREEHSFANQTGLPKSSASKEAFSTRPSEGNRQPWWKTAWKKIVFSLPWPLMIVVIASGYWVLVQGSSLFRISSSYAQFSDSFFLFVFILLQKLVSFLLYIVAVFDLIKYRKWGFVLFQGLCLARIVTSFNVLCYTYPQMTNDISLSLKHFSGFLIGWTTNIALMILLFTARREFFPKKKNPHG